jgi:hypothetical protein
MISIIISSSNPEYLSAVKKNIDETVGIPYEILAVPNGDGKRGICEVYNAAGALAKYDVLCFMHEDVILHTPDWGKKVVEIMRNPEIGLLGIAGSEYKSLTPAPWACPGVLRTRHKANILQRFKFVNNKTVHEYHNSDNEVLSHVVAIDGVWMCTRKDVFDEFKFDDVALSRFHGYDVDYSLQVGIKYKVYVTYDVLLEHFSEGNYSDEWLDAMFTLHAKHQARLPLSTKVLSKAETRRGEKAAAKELLKQVKGLNYSVADKVKLLWDYNLVKVLGPKLFIAFHLNILLKRY